MGTGLSNYIFMQYAPSTLTVVARDATVTAGDRTKEFGATPDLGATAFTAGGFMSWDGVTGVTLASDGTAATAEVGTYPITPSAAVGTGLANYSIHFADGTLTVADTTLPVISAPPSVFATATGPSGATVTFSVTASDVVEGNVAVTLSKASGTVFPLGTTMVTATAVDAHGNAAESVTFPVYVSYQMTLLKPNADGSSTYKAGSDLLAQFRLAHATTTPINNATATLTVYRGSTLVLGPTAFAYIGGKLDYYNCGFSTKKWAQGVYTLKIDLSDGSPVRSNVFALTK